MQDEPERPLSRARLRRHRAWLLLLGLVLFGFPLMVTSRLLQARYTRLVPGPQPGGSVHGIVLDENGAPRADQRVEVFAVADGEPRALVEARTGAEGRFSLEVPPITGLYRVYAGGGELQRVARDVSLAGRGGSVAEARELRFELEPAAILEVSFVRADGSPVRGGRAVLTRRGGLFSPLQVPFRAERELDGDEVVFDGLPPMEFELYVRFATAEELRASFDLDVGRKISRFTLR